MTASRFVWSLTFTLVLAACLQDAAAPVAPTDLATGTTTEASTPEFPGVLTPEGIGPIVVGKAPPSALEADEVQLSDSCRTYNQDAYPRIFVMTDGTVVTRVTVMSGSPVKTAQRIAAGASEVEVRKAYPGLTQERHKYETAPAKYLDWRRDGGESGFRFEIDREGRVGSIHAGREPYIEFVEGCA